MEHILWYNKTAYEKPHINLVRYYEELFKKRVPQWGENLATNKSNKPKNFLHNLAKPHDEPSREELFDDFFRENINISSLMLPNWLKSKENPDRYLLTELLYQHTFPLPNNKEVEQKEEKKEKGTGEHTFHPLAVMAVGQYLLCNHYVNYNNKENTRDNYILLIDAIKLWLKNHKEKIYKSTICCEKFCEENCISYIWQLLALTHDVGYQVTVLPRILNHLGVESNFIGVPADYATFIKNKESYTSKVASIANTLDANEVSQYIIDNWLKIRIDKTKDDPEENKRLEIIRQLTERYVKEYVSNNIKPIYDYFLHSLYSTAVLINVYKQLNETEMHSESCLELVYDILIESVLVHHFPTKGMVDEKLNWKWKFTANPFAYLLKVTDEIKMTKFQRTFIEPNKSYELVENKTNNIVKHDKYEIHCDRIFPKFIINSEHKNPYLEIICEDCKDWEEDIDKKFKKDMFEQLESDDVFKVKFTQSK